MNFVEIVDRLDRAAMKHQRVTLGAEHVQALLTSPAYATMCDLKAKEIAALWQAESEPEPQPEPSSDRSGSGIVPTGMSGASVGTMTAENQAAVERAASKRASEAVKMIGLQKRRRTP